MPPRLRAAAVVAAAAGAAAARATRANPAGATAAASAAAIAAVVVAAAAAVTADRRHGIDAGRKASTFRPSFFVGKKGQPALKRRCRVAPGSLLRRKR